MDSNFDVFTDGLLSEKIFSCASCSNLLSPPIMLVKDIGNVCMECLVTHEWQGIQNENLALILQRLKIPCRYHISGCTSRPLFSCLKEHENNCEFHERPCLMAIKGCEWKGVQSNFPNHFVEDHADHVLVSPAGVFSIEVDLQEEVNIIKLLKSKYECLLKIRSGAESLIYAVCDIKGNCNYDCSIKHLGRNGNCVETKSNVSTLNKVNETIINILALRQMTESIESITIEVKLSSANDCTVFDEKILQYFECPVCKTLMKPPIYQCKFGHSVCSNCRPKLEKCPNCRAIFGTTRNFSLEALTASINYSCVYHFLGCEEALSVADADKHEAMCSFKPYPCPLENCSFKGTHSNIVKHLEHLHKDKVIASDYYKATVEFRLEQMIEYFNFNQKFYMIFDENIFRLTFKRNSDYSFWAVEVLRKKDESAIFVYDIGIIDMRKPDRKLLRSDLCFIDVSSDDLMKKCVLFPNNILGSYSCNGMFTYYCQIRKR